MSRRPRPAIALKTIALAAVSIGLVAGASAPAFATYTAPGTMTFTAVPGSYEGDGAAMGGFCPAVTDEVTITSAPAAGVTIPPINYRGDGGGDPSLEGYFDTIGSYTIDTQLVPPGSDVTFTASCIDGGAVVATADSVVTTYTTGAAITAPATVVIGENVIVTGTCGESDAGYVAFQVLKENGDEVYFEGLTPAADGSWSASFLSDTIGGGDGPAVPGDVLYISAGCRDAVQTQLFYSFRYAEVLVTDPPTDSPTTPLAATGADASVPVAAGLTLLVVGATLALIRRRRVA